MWCLFTTAHNRPPYIVTWTWVPGVNFMPYSITMCDLCGLVVVLYYLKIISWIVLVLRELKLANYSYMSVEWIKKLWIEYCISFQQIYSQKCTQSRAHSNDFVWNCRTQTWQSGILRFCVIERRSNLRWLGNIRISTMWTHGVIITLVY